jgi:ribokinase
MPNNSRPILVIGSLNMDLVARCEHLPREGQTIFGSDFFMAAGGKGANQAVAAARLGGCVTMAGCVGCDQFGRKLLAGLAKYGIRTDHIETVDKPTGTALITVDGAGHNTIIVISGANGECGPALVDRALADVGTPGVLLLQHEVPASTNAHAIRHAKATGWFVVLNPAPARAVPPQLLTLIDVIAPNETEAAALTGVAIASRQDALVAARQLVDQGARAALITLGGDGALYCDADKALHCPATKVHAIDTTAAGDAYLGALATALAEGQPVEQSLSLAAVAAGFAVTRLGAQPSLATRAELEQFIISHGQPEAAIVPG